MIRFGVSMEEELLRDFDALIERGGQGNRSEAVRDLVRSRLDEERVADPSSRVMGVLTMVYDHHQRELRDHLVEIQHEHLDLVITTMHVHVDHATCLEVLLLRGVSGELRRFSATVGGLKGVVHTQLLLTAAATGGEGER